MSEKIKPALLQFLQPAALPLRVLVVEDLHYLPRLRQVFPIAELYGVAADKDRLSAYAATGAELTVCDYLSEPLPYPRASFDYIISDLTLEQAGNPQDIAAGFSTYLKETGSWLTSFRNLRHWSEIQNIMEGHYYHVAARLYVRPEFEKLLYASYYKDVHLRPQRREAPEGLIAKLEAAGFENLHDDLETEFWLVKADRSMPELALLKSMYTKEDRQELAWLLHRIEYDVDTERQCAAFWALYARLGLFPDYVAAFVHESVFHIVRFFRHLEQYAGTHGAEIAAIRASEIAAHPEGELAQGGEGNA